MHEFGAAYRMTLNPDTPDERILLDIPSWSFEWQLYYVPVEEIRIEPSDMIRFECTWDRANLFMRHERAVNQAAKRLVGTSVRESGTAQLSMNFYEAGSALAFATELAIQEANPDLDLFDFWRELLASSRAKGDLYTEADYYALADRLAPGSGIGERLRAFVDTRHEDTPAAFMDLLAPFVAVRADLDWESGELSLEPADGGR